MTNVPCLEVTASVDLLCVSQDGSRCGGPSLLLSNPYLPLCSLSYPYPSNPYLLLKDPLRIHCLTPTCALTICVTAHHTVGGFSIKVTNQEHKMVALHSGSLGQAGDTGESSRELLIPVQLTVCSVRLSHGPMLLPLSAVVTPGEQNLSWR